MAVMPVQDVFVPPLDTGAAGVPGFTVIWIVFVLVTTTGEAHTAFEVNSSDTISPSFSKVVEKLFWFDPTSPPFTFH